MIDKKRFSIQKVKKVLHKIGKYWAIVTTAIIGLFTGSTMVANNAHANPQTNQKPTNHADLTSKQDNKSKLVNNNVLSSAPKSIQSNAVIKNQIHNLFNNAVINGLNGTKATSDNTYAGLVKSSSVNVRPVSKSSRTVDVQNMNQTSSPAVNLQVSAHSLKTVRFLNNIINDNINPNSNPATHQAAVSAYNNLISLADANNIKQFVSPKGMPIGNLRTNNTWMGDFNQLANDINVINNNGYNRRLNRLNNYLQAIRSKFINELPVRPNHVNALTNVRDNAHDVLLAITSKEAPASQNVHDYVNYKISNILSTNDLVNIDLLDNKASVNHIYHDLSNIMTSPSAVNNYQKILDAMKGLIHTDKVKVHKNYNIINHNLNRMNNVLYGKPFVNKHLASANWTDDTRNVGNQVDNLDSSASLLAESNEKSAASSYDNSTSTAVESISTAAQLIANRINNNLDELSMTSYAEAAASVASTVKSLISNDVNSNVDYSLINNNADEVEAKAKHFTRSNSNKVNSNSQQSVRSKASVLNNVVSSSSSNSSVSSDTDFKDTDVQPQNNNYNRSDYFHWNDLVNKTLFGKMGHRYYDVLIIKPCSIYNNVNFSSNNLVRRLNPGEVIHVNNVIDINQDHVNVNCFELTNWSFITSNKQFTKVL